MRDLVLSFSEFIIARPRRCHHWVAATTSNYGSQLCIWISCSVEKIHTNRNKTRRRRQLTRVQFSVSQIARVLCEIRFQFEFGLVECKQKVFIWFRLYLYVTKVTMNKNIRQIKSDGKSEGKNQKMKNHWRPYFPNIIRFWYAHEHTHTHTYSPLK